MDDNKFESQMTLYSVDTSDGLLYFDDEKELEIYVKKNHTNNITKIEFMGNILNSIDVIKQTFKDGTCRYVSVANEEGYIYYDYEQSKKEHVPIWEYSKGSIKEIYEIFESYGVKFEDYTYNIIDNHQKVKSQLKRQLA